MCPAQQEIRTLKIKASREKRTAITHGVHVHAKPLDHVGAHLQTSARSGNVQRPDAIQPRRLHSLPEAAPALIQRPHEPCKQATGWGATAEPQTKVQQPKQSRSKSMAGGGAWGTPYS